jgi:hypothetical protein
LASLLGAPAEKLKHLVVYNSEADAEAAGLHPRYSGTKAHAG